MNKYGFIFIIIFCFCACKTPEARQPESVNNGSFIKTSAARNKKLFALEKLKIEAYIKTKDSMVFKASENGFWYAIDTLINNPELVKPKFGSIINYTHSISNLNGQTIYSIEELKTRNYAMDKQELFSGLREGLKLMKAGETFTFIFPSQKAYGYYGDENKIGANTTIVVKATINSIKN